MSRTWRNSKRSKKTGYKFVRAAKQNKRRIQEPKKGTK